MINQGIQPQVMLHYNIGHVIYFTVKENSRWLLSYFDQIKVIQIVPSLS